jgi:hypothetical protein
VRAFKLTELINQSINRAPEKDLYNKDFLGKGSATKQTGRFNSLNCLKGEVCADESAEILGFALTRLQTPKIFLRTFFVIASCDFFYSSGKPFQSL